MRLKKQSWRGPGDEIGNKLLNLLGEVSIVTQHQLISDDMTLSFRLVSTVNCVQDTLRHSE